MKVAREKAAVTEPRLLHPLLAIPSRRRGLSHDQQARPGWRTGGGRGGVLTLHDRDAVARPRDLWPLPPSPGSHQCVAEVPLSQAGAQELQQPPEPPGQNNRLPPHPVKRGKRAQQGLGAGPREAEGASHPTLPRATGLCSSSTLRAPSPQLGAHPNLPHPPPRESDPSRHLF